VDEFVFVTVPMALARPDPGFERNEIDAELRKPCGVSDAQPFSAAARRVMRRRIPCAFALGGGSEIDLLHGRSDATLESHQMRWKSAGRLFRRRAARRRASRTMERAQAGQASGRSIFRVRNHADRTATLQVSANPLCLRLSALPRNTPS